MWRARTATPPSLSNSLNCRKLVVRNPKPQRTNLSEALTALLARQRTTFPCIGIDASARLSGRKKRPSEPVTFHTDMFANHYILDNCPLVRSIGLDVTSGKASAWLPDSLPFFVKDPSQLQIVCPEENRFYATRIEEHAPIFTSNVTFAQGAVSEVGACPVPKGPDDSEHEEPSRSAPPAEPLHPAEDAAVSLLKSGRSPNAKGVKRLFTLVDKSPSPRPCVDDEHEEEELSSFSTGCFRRGGVIGLRKNTSRFPLTTLFSNTSAQPHRDFHNAPVENSVVPLGGFRIAMVQHLVLLIHPSRTVGYSPSENGVIKFSAEDVVHSTQPWVGDRQILVAYTVFDPDKIDQSTMIGLTEAGFSLVSDSLNCASFRVDAEGAAPSPDGSAAPAPPEGGESRVPDQVKTLRDEAMFVQHRLFHFFKNPFCDICNQAKLLSKCVRWKPRDPESDPDPLEASAASEFQKLLSYCP